MEKDWRFHHFAIMAFDIDKAVEYYESCGIGPFEPEITVDTSTYPESYKSYGKTGTTPIKIKARLFKADPIPIMFEFIEPLEGESIHKEFLEEHGEGVGHIAFIVDDLEKETAKLVEKGFPVVYSQKRTGSAFAYFDTRKFGNLYLELMEIEK